MHSYFNKEMPKAASGEDNVNYYALADTISYYRNLLNLTVSWLTLAEPRNLFVLSMIAHNYQIINIKTIYL